MTPMKKLAVITVTYNAAHNLPFFLPSLEKNAEAIGGVIFVDNNSSDDTLQILQLWKSHHAEYEVSIVENDSNCGYAHGVNQGIHKALKDGYEYFLVTNNDIIFEMGAFSFLVEASRAQDTDALGVPASVNVTDFGLGYILNNSTRLPAHNPTLPREKLKDEIGKHPFIRVGFVHGGTILFRRRFFEEVGTYDGALFFGGDELDFLYRVHDYNETHPQAIKCEVSLEAARYMDNLTKHNTGHKLIKATRILQGTARVYLKHRFTPLDDGLYAMEWNIISSLAKGSLLRYGVLSVLALRALAIEIFRYYTR